MHKSSSQEFLVFSDTSHGLGVITACLFIVGEIAGTGILALPYALKLTGWIGVSAIISIWLVSGYCGVLLGKCWLILEERDESLKSIKTRNAYSLIGVQAMGRLGEQITTWSLISQMFGCGVVLLVLAAEMLTQLASQVGLEVTFCEWIIIAGVILLPFTYAGSPVDFWPISISAMASTAIASLLLLVEITRQHINPPSTQVQDAPTPEESQVTLKTFLLGLSTIAFAFSGASAMPTIQNDMKDKGKFILALLIGFVLLVIIYLPISILGYWAFSTSTLSSVLRNMNQSPVVTIIKVLILIHVFSAYLIFLNPVNLNVEHALGIKHSFNRYRSMTRTTIALATIIFGLSVPKFDKLLNLVGASAVCLQSFILPCLFYYKLRSNSLNETEKISMPHKIVIFTVIALATVLAAVGSFFALEDILAPSSFTSPCYVCNNVTM